MDAPAHDMLRRLKAIREQSQRRIAVATWLLDGDPAATVTLIDEIFGTWAVCGDADIAATLDCVIQTLGDPGLVPAERLAALYGAATRADLAVVAKLMFEHSPPTATERELEKQLAPERKLSPQGRPLSLGERKALARTHDRELLRRVLADPHPDVIEILCDNPHTTERDLLVVASRRPSVPSSLASIAANDRWRPRYEIRRALVQNPYTPVNIAIRLSLLLRPVDLSSIRDNPAMAAAVRDYAVIALTRRNQAAAAFENAAKWN